VFLSVLRFCLYFPCRHAIISNISSFLGFLGVSASSVVLSSALGSLLSELSSPAASAALSALLPLVPSGVRVSVGCARGVDSACRSFFAGSSSLLLFSVASGRFGSGRSAFARRSSRCVLSVAAGSRGLLVALPTAGVCPAGVRPSRSFFGGGSGSWGSVAFALGRGRRVLLWLPSGSRPPVWCGVSWSAVASVPGGGWWLGVPAPVVAQLSLF
jgi:hypothetical protein